MSEDEVIPETLQEASQRYLRAAHAMQSGVAAKMPVDPMDTQPKHLRVGVNSAMVDHAALAKLLVEKGILTELEYFTAIADAMEQEVERYRVYLKNHYGVEISLG